MISTECLTASVGVAWSTRGFRQHGDCAADEIRGGHQFHVVAHRAVLAGDDLDRIRHRRRIGALEARDQRVALRGRLLDANKDDEGDDGGDWQRDDQRTGPTNAHDAVQ